MCYLLLFREGPDHPYQPQPSPQDLLMMRNLPLQAAATQATFIGLPPRWRFYESPVLGNPPAVPFVELFEQSWIGFRRLTVGSE